MNMGIVGGTAVLDETKRKGDFMITNSGRVFWPLDPRPEEIHLEDVAHHLSLSCRWTGACRRHFSVGHHALIVSFLVPQAFALDGLHHDDTEAYMSDLARPVKKNIPQYQEIEALIHYAVAQRFNLNWPMPSAVHVVDTHVVADEAAALFRPVPDWVRLFRRSNAKFRFVPSSLVKRMYLHRHHELTDRAYARSLRGRVMRLLTRLAVGPIANGGRTA